MFIQVRCMTDIYHPNIDTEGNVCLNILREDWNPILDLNAIVFGLLHLLLDPNPDDPLNEKAAEEFRSDQISFANNVSRVMDKVITAAALSED
ncbi:nedd8-conjugating enzyme UbcE2M-like isoform X2 [Parasteatoda tepidariorum]|uniref:nedd8-conjugating enzyme UbcE2M-like isoform X2 n=1 Tax=Parasteatoda tepidariorum TaxID=114398 RepID=UPI001C71C466|nr:nedd8-conjugating enzyme UbcE2M-like isoform X2 [Parasteatoda tepidariorum]